MAVWLPGGLRFSSIQSPGCGLTLRLPRTAARQAFHGPGEERPPDSPLTLTCSAPVAVCVAAPETNAVPVRAPHDCALLPSLCESLL